MSVVATDDAADVTGVTTGGTPSDVDDVLIDDIGVCTTDVLVDEIDVGITDVLIDESNVEITGVLVDESEVEITDVFVDESDVKITGVLVDESDVEVTDVLVDEIGVVELPSPGLHTASPKLSMLQVCLSHERMRMKRTVRKAVDLTPNHNSLFSVKA